MNRRPRLLDLFCGAGGAAMGYHRAGFEVVGVDINPQPNYPFTFVRGDALEEVEIARLPGHPFSAVHASPPCQHYTAMKTMWNHRSDHPDLIDATRLALQRWGLPYVIENVRGAPLPSAAQLCGTSFGLGVTVYDGWRELRRHRWFESNVPMMAPPCQHRYPTIGIYGDHARDRRRRHGERAIDFPDRDKVRLAQAALDMPWTSKWRELLEAIPPAFTEYVGAYLIQALERVA
jgi:DNA (cytosine-5)-methyltransferase 1